MANGAPEFHSSFETSAKQRAADILSAEPAEIHCVSSAGATPAPLLQGSPIPHFSEVNQHGINR